MKRLIVGKDFVAVARFSNGHYILGDGSEVNKKDILAVEDIQ